MTHDPLFVARLLHHPSVLKAAVVYDFIPLDEANRYLPTPATHLNYIVSMYWLARHDMFLSISRSTADRLKSLLGVPDEDVTVIGAPLAPSFEEAALHKLPSGPRTHILVPGGGDQRKNVECAIRAHARSRLMQSMSVRLIVTGTYPPECLISLRALHAAAGGKPDLLCFPGHVVEQSLVELYQGAACVLCLSRSEGFSIPVIEAAACGAPVVASSIPAHMELLQRSDLLVPPDDDAAVSQLLEQIVTDLAFRDGVVARQKEVFKRFQGREVAKRFWSPITKRAERRSLCPPAVVTRSGRRPQVALLTPLPPDRSGVADYTAASLRELGRLVDLHVFSQTVNPSPVAGPSTVRPLSALAHVSSGFDRVVSVVGNSHFHLPIFQYLIRYGGACIEHDNRLLGFYRILLGEERCRRQAEKELKRPLGPGELERWLADESTLETLFLGEIAEIAEPLCLHSRVTVRLVEERYGVRPVYLPFSVYREPSPEALDPNARGAARRRLGIASETIAIVSFGFVHESKAPEDCIWALEMLRAWGYAAQLWFVGQVLGGSPASLMALAARIGLDGHVIFAGEYVNDTTYSDFLLAADVAIQLRTHGFGGLSGALLDCIAAGLPTVASEDLALAMEAPAYVLRVPDQISPLLIAEAAADLIDGGGCQRSRWEEQRRSYTAEHSFRRYAELLVASIGLELTNPSRTSE
jgi:glycosyltransferase involved in cell wall biosynthesis